MKTNKMGLVLIVGVLMAAVPAWSEEQKVSENKIDVSKLTCKQTMAGNDTDREVVIAFFHGYMAGKKNQEIIDLHAASARSDKVMDFCLSNPTSTVMDAFIKLGE